MLLLPDASTARNCTNCPGATAAFPSSSSGLLGSVLCATESFKLPLFFAGSGARAARGAPVAHVLPAQTPTRAAPPDAVWRTRPSATNSLALCPLSPVPARSCLSRTGPTISSKRRNRSPFKFRSPSLPRDAGGGSASRPSPYSFPGWCKRAATPSSTVPLVRRTQPAASPPRDCRRRKSETPPILRPRSAPACPRGPPPSSREAS